MKDEPGRDRQIRKKTSAACAFLLALLTCHSAHAKEAKLADADDSSFRGSFSLGFSYPLVMSISLGAMLPLGKQDKNDIFPTSPALRIDGEVGLGGGSVAAGIFIPAGDGYALSLKAARMRTWLWTWNEQSGRTFNGGVVEFAMPSVHGGPKLGLGSFRDMAPVNNTRRTFTYVFVGVGW